MKTRYTIVFALLAFIFHMNAHSKSLPISEFAEGISNNLKIDAMTLNDVVRTKELSPIIGCEGVDLRWSMFSTGERNYSGSSTLDTDGNLFPRVAAPIFHVDARQNTKTQNVIISSETEGATIYYTLDGSEPTTDSLIYTTSISISETTTIKAFATNTGMDDSDVRTETYNVEASAAVSCTTEAKVDDRIFGVSNAIVVRNCGVSYFTIYDISGQVVTSGVANIGETFIDVTTGIYLAHIGNETYKVVVK